MDDADADARFHADLARAIADSKANASPTISIISLSTDSDADQPVSPPTAAPSTSVFLTERAQLEQERLARLKRLRGDLDDSDRAVPPPPKRSTPPGTTDDAPPSQVTLDPEGEVFWDGELRQTANKHVEPRRNGEDGKPIFRLSQIIGDVRLVSSPTPTLLTPRIQKSQIELAIISTYALQLSWIYTFFDPSTPVVLVTQPAPSENGSSTIKQVLPNWIRVTPFLRGGRGVMHMKVRTASPGDLYAHMDLVAKFFLLFYKSGRLRIVISTANLIDHDWRDIENTVWVQDVPRRPSPVPHEPKADDFPSVFERILYAINVAPAITSLVSTDVRRPRKHSLSWLTMLFKAPQHSTHSPARRGTPHTLGLFAGATGARPEPRREARGLACCPQVRPHCPYARRHPAQPTKASRLTRVPGPSSSSVRTP